jgi:predicted transport protein
MKNDYYADPYTQTMIKNMPEKTGKSLEEWFDLIKKRKLSTHSEIMALIKGEHGVSHGFAHTVSLLFRQKAAGGPPTEEALIAAQYEKKPQHKPIYDHLVSEVKRFGNDVEITPKKAYVSFRRRRQFGILQPSTKTRMDLGLNLDPDTPASDPLIIGDKWSGMCSHRIEIHSIDEVTPAVIDWLRKAYEHAG